MTTPSFNSNTLTELPFGLPGRIYRSPMPFRSQDPQGKLFQEYLEKGIQVVVMLVTEDETRWNTGRDLASFYSRQGLQVIHCPIPDFSIPRWETLAEALDEVTDKAHSGMNIAVHCNAGLGRTGTFMACLAHRLLDLSGQEAINWVRTYIPPALENPDQEQFVKEFSA